MHELSREQLQKWSRAHEKMSAASKCLPDDLRKGGGEGGHAPTLSASRVALSLCDWCLMVEAVAKHKHRSALYVEMCNCLVDCDKPRSGLVGQENERRTFKVLENHSKPSHSPSLSRKQATQLVLHASLEQTLDRQFVPGGEPRVTFPGSIHYF